MNLLQQLEAEQVAALAKKKKADFGPGDTVKVNVKVVEESFDEKTKQTKRRERIQAFEGVVLGRQGQGLNENFTVRKISYGEGVERVFPVNSPNIDKVEVDRESEVMRARLYYLRNRTGKAAVAVKEREIRTVAVPAAAPEVAPAATPVAAS
jgi:large subunit ribosomal protein L19